MRMEVYPIDAPLYLVEADIIKPLKARPIDLPHPMIRHQEFFLPPHKDILSVRAVLVVEIRVPRLGFERAPGVESGPVPHVFFVARTPIEVLGLERIFRTDDFTFEECGQGWVLCR